MAEIFPRITIETGCRRSCKSQRLGSSFHCSSRHGTRAHGGGRGSAKSNFFADNWLRENVAEKLDVVCLRETLKSLEFSVKKLLESKISAYNAGDYFEVQDRRIKSLHGGVTIFEGMQNHTADSIKSLEGFTGRGSRKRRTPARTA